MKNSLLDSLASLGPSASQADECKTPQKDCHSAAAVPSRQRATGVWAPQLGKLHAPLAAFMAFLVVVLLCVMAAATVASHDLPLLFGGFQGARAEKHQ